MNINKINKEIVQTQQTNHTESVNEASKEFSESVKKALEGPPSPPKESIEKVQTGLTHEELMLLYPEYLSQEWYINLIYKDKDKVGKRKKKRKQSSGTLPYNYENDNFGYSIKRIDILPTPISDEEYNQIVYDALDCLEELCSVSVDNIYTKVW